MSRYDRKADTDTTRRSSQNEFATPGKRTLVARSGQGEPEFDFRGALDRAAATTGHAPDPGVRDSVERATGGDLANAVVHSGAESAEAAHAVGARAYATGNDVHFAAGQYNPGTPDGDHLLAHELAHTLQQQGATPLHQDKLEISEPEDAHEAEADRVADAAVSGGRAPVTHASGVQRLSRAPDGSAAAAPVRDLRNPAQYPTFEEWCAGFGPLPVFHAHDTPGNHPTNFDVIGEPASDAAPASDHVAERRGEQHIDDVSRSWIDANLPNELRRTAYELPADCADVALILRHVWLHAHGRAETYGKWRIGTGAGATANQRQQAIHTLIRDKVSSGSVGAMVGTAYNDDGGRVRSFLRLQSMLHPGDMLVWEHRDESGHRTGGHTQTIQTIQRNPEGQITSITCLQGNQPVFEQQAEEILAAGQTGTTESRLRDLPGRRIERNTLEGDDLKDVDGIWTWGDHTVLVAVGPASGTPRPPARRGRDGQRHRSVTDWVSGLRGASLESLPRTWEAALFELRAAIEGEFATVTAEQGQQLGDVAGRRLTTLARTHRQRGAALSAEMAAQAEQFAASAASHALEVQAILGAARTSFVETAPQTGSPTEP